MGHSSDSAVSMSARRSGGTGGKEVTTLDGADTGVGIGFEAGGVVDGESSGTG